MAPRALAALAALLVCAGAAADDAILYNITAEEYFEMPTLFELDEYWGCVSRRGIYCLGSFDLFLLDERQRPLYQRMQRYSANWVDNFNHTQAHRGLCISRRCPPAAATPTADHAAWFSHCVNASISAEYGLGARLSRLQYCEAGPPRAAPPSPLGRALLAALAVLFALAVASTLLDMLLPAHQKKGLQWALSWSVPGCWRALQAPPPAGDTDLSSFDGLRVLCMACVLIEHVCWLATQSFLANTWEYEQMRRATDVMLMVNSTLVVQIFFMMSSFLLAHKILGQRRHGQSVHVVSTFFSTMVDRLIRVSPSYYLVVWFAASWWERLGSGPQWAPLVGSEAAICRDKWWAQLLYVHNVVRPDDKCLIQTWYLAADTQLYAGGLLLSLSLRRRALPALLTLLLSAVTALFALAYMWHLVPTFVMHSPELVRAAYSGESSFNVLYQSPLSNAPGALVGLLLAHLHHHLQENKVPLKDYKLFRWVSVLGPAVAVAWAAKGPALLGAGPPPRAAAAALAAMERPVFSFFVAVAMLGAMHDVPSPLRSFLSWRGWATPARLSFGVLLLHMPLNKSYVAARLAPGQINRQVAFIEAFGVALVSYICAIPLSLLVELPVVRLRRSLRRLPPTPRPQHPPPAEKADL